MHLLTKGTPFNDLSEGCAVRIKISLYFHNLRIVDNLLEKITVCLFLLFVKVTQRTNQMACPPTRLFEDFKWVKERIFRLE